MRNDLEKFLACAHGELELDQDATAFDAIAERTTEKALAHDLRLRDVVIGPLSERSNAGFEVVGSSQDHDGNALVRGPKRAHRLETRRVGKIQIEQDGRWTRPRKLSDGFLQYSVELKLQDVNLAQIVDALYGVKTLTAPVAVSNMRVTRRIQDPHTYDVEMTCIALAKGA